MSLYYKQLPQTGAEIFLAEGTNTRRRHHILAASTNTRRRHHINLRATFGHIAIYQGLEKQTSPIMC